MNRSNYEIYFSDYLDGNLPDNQVDDFLDFLEKNPDLHKELKEVSAVKLSAGKQVFQNKEALLKNGSTDSSSFDYQAVAYIEGDLSEEDEDSFLNQISHDREKEKQFDLFLRTNLQPDESIVFTNKETLLRKPAGKVFLFWGSRVAALFILIFGFWSVWNFSFKAEPDIQYTEAKPAPVQQLPNQENTSISEFVEKADDPEKEDERLITRNSKTIKPVGPKIKKQQVALITKRPTEREEAPQTIDPLPVKVINSFNKAPFALAPMKHDKIGPNGNYLTIDEFLAQKILNKSKGEPISFSSILNAGLDAVSNASNERLEYETNQKGSVSEISLNTRLLAFSIPLKKDK